MPRNVVPLAAAIALTLAALVCARPAAAQSGVTQGVATTVCGTPFGTYTSGRPGPQQVDLNGNVCIYVSGGSLNPMKVTPSALTTATVVTGGTAVTLICGPINGGWLKNGDNASMQGIAQAENFYVDAVGTPGSTDAAANGTTVALQPGQPFTIPALANSGVCLKGNAATSGHIISGEVY